MDYTYEEYMNEHIGDRDAGVKSTQAQESGRYDEWD